MAEIILTSRGEHRASKGRLGCKRTMLSVARLGRSSPALAYLKEIEMKRISEEQFQEWCGSHQIKGCGKRVTMCEIECRPIAQLESCEKEYEVMLVTKNMEINTLQAVIREIFEEIENEMFDIYGGILKCREGTWEKAYKDWQVLKQKWGVE